MSIFNTAIQTLSEIAIQESGVIPPQTADDSLLEEFGAMLNNMPSLTEDEMRFDVRMVPVKESTNLGKYLIEMEDLSRYMITNRIPSVRDAIGNILECNGLDGQFMNVALVIDEASILNEVDDLGINLNSKYPTPQPGLGETIYGRPDAMKYIRRIANSKELLDTLYNTYGIPFIKKNYTQVGLLKEETDLSSDKEDVQMKKSPNDEVLHEKDTDRASGKMLKFKYGVDEKDEGINEITQAQILANRASQVMGYRNSMNSSNSSTSISSNGPSTTIHQSGHVGGISSNSSTPAPTVVSSSSSSPSSSTTVAAKPTTTSSAPQATQSSSSSSSGGSFADRIRAKMLASQNKYKAFQAGDKNAYGSPSNTSSAPSASPTPTSSSSSSNTSSSSNIPDYNKINDSDSLMVKQAKLAAQKKAGGPTQSLSDQDSNRISQLNSWRSSGSATTEAAKIQYIKDVAAGKYDYQL